VINLTRWRQCQFRNVVDLGMSRDLFLKLALLHADAFACMACGCMWFVFMVNMSNVLEVFLPTVRFSGIGTGISEASKRVPIFSFATQ